MNPKLGFAIAFLILPTVLSAADAPAPHEPPASDWRNVDPNNLVLIDTKYGEVAVELAPQFAPRHVERMRALIRAHFYDGLSFYRVIDGFVAQGGVGEATASTKDKPIDPEIAKRWPNLKAEFDRPIAGGPHFTPLGNRDLFAPDVGHADGFPAGRDRKAGRMWMIHCPGTFAFARDNGADTASTEFYIVIGEAPRRLDRNLTAFGRVIDGQQYVQKLERGDPAVDNGVIADPAKRDPIIRVRLASDMPESERPKFQVMRTESKSFAKAKAAKKNPAPEFYHRTPPPILDICIMPASVRRAPG